MQSHSTVFSSFLAIGETVMVVINIDCCVQVLCVQPSTGYVQPGGSAACKITLCSHVSPSFYNLDLLCQVEKARKSYSSVEYVNV